MVNRQNLANHGANGVADLQLGQHGDTGGVGNVDLNDLTARRIDDPEFVVLHKSPRTTVPLNFDDPNSHATGRRHRPRGNL